MASTGTNDEIFAQNVDVSPINGRADVVELCDEGVLQPVDEALAEENHDGGTKDSLKE